MDLCEKIGCLLRRRCFEIGERGAESASVFVCVEDVMMLFGFFESSSGGIPSLSKSMSPSSLSCSTRCHGAGPPASQATPASPSAPPPVPARSPARVAATVGSTLPAVTASHHTKYGVGARMFEAMWSGQGCRVGGDRRGLGCG